MPTAKARRKHTSKIAKRGFLVAILAPKVFIILSNDKIVVFAAEIYGQ